MAKAYWGMTQGGDEMIKRNDRVDVLLTAGNNHDEWQPATVLEIEAAECGLAFFKVMLDDGLRFKWVGNKSIKKRRV